MKKEKRLIILSGAGLSAESGIKTFRDDNGLWHNHDVEQICNIRTWKNNYKQVHNFYNQLRNDLKNKKPNKMHYQIAQWQQEYKNNCIIITQNIDDLLEKAGCKNVIHLHGTLKKVYCTECFNEIDIEYQSYDFKKCNKCNSEWIKPSIIFFGEQAPLYQTLYEVFNSINKDDIVLIIGTSGAVINVNYLVSDKSFNILNNLCPEIYINEKLFDAIFYEKATDAASKIDQLIKQKMN